MPNKLFSTENVFQSTSDWHTLKRRIAWFLRFKYFLAGDNGNSGKVTFYLNSTPQKLQFSRTFRNNIFGDILSALCDKKSIKNKQLRKLDPFIDERGLLRVGEKVQLSHLNFEAKHPIILPRKDDNASKLVVSTHKIIGPMARETVVSKLKEKYWISGVNGIIKKMHYNCVTCRKMNANPSLQKCPCCVLTEYVEMCPPSTRLDWTISGRSK